MPSDNPTPPELQPGMRLDRYELVCVLARGGMGSVWVARLEGKHGFEKLVALKTILPYYAAEPQFRTMFLDEARIASGIVHPNVAQTIDLGEQDGVLYTVIEWMEGESLRSLQRALEREQAKVPLGIALRVIADACAGLHAAHEHRAADGTPLGIVHRDVSPHNILVTSGGVSKLIDFGVAKAKGRLSNETSPGEIKGRIDYMPPEQAMGGEVDRRADIWGLGATLYHVVAGVPPYGGENQVLSLHKLLSRQPPKPLDPSVPLPVQALILKALSHDVSVRFGTAEEMARAIDNAMRETHLSPSHADVGAFLNMYMAASAQKRRQAVESGLKALAERRSRPQAISQRSEAPAHSEPVSSLSLESHSESVSRRLSEDTASSGMIASGGRLSAESQQRSRVAFALGISLFAAIGLIGIVGFLYGRPTATPAQSNPAVSMYTGLAPPSADASTSVSAVLSAEPLPPVASGTSKGVSTGAASVRPPPKGTSKAVPRPPKRDDDVDDGI